ncbi:MAG: hypothetical protein ABII13_02890, partial [Patescibacteria group bacterium]
MLQLVEGSGTPTGNLVTIATDKMVLTKDGNLVFSGTSFYSSATTKTASCGLASKYWKDVYTDKLYFGSAAIFSKTENFAQIQYEGQMIIYGAESLAPESIAPALSIYSFQQDYPSLLVQGALGQTESIMQIVQGGMGSGNFLNMDSTAGAGGNVFAFTGAGYLGINQAAPSAMLDIVQKAADKTGLEINGAANRSAPLLDLKEGSGTSTSPFMRLSSASGTADVFLINNTNRIVAYSQNDNYWQFQGRAASSTNWHGNFWDNYRSRGTHTAPAACQADDYIFYFDSWGYDGSAYQRVARIKELIDGTVSAGVVPGAIDFSTGTSTASVTTRLRITSGGYIGIGGETNPIGLVELTHTAPYIYLHNSTEEDTNGGREGRICWRGEQSGGEETMGCIMEAAHDGSADDQKFYWRLLLNDGNDGESPTQVLKIDSTLLANFAGDINIATSKVFKINSTQV